MAEIPPYPATAAQLARNGLSQGTGECLRAMQALVAGDWDDEARKHELYHIIAANCMEAEDSSVMWEMVLWVVIIAGDEHLPLVGDWKSWYIKVHVCERASDYYELTILPYLAQTMPPENQDDEAAWIWTRRARGIWYIRPSDYVDGGKELRAHLMHVYAHMYARTLGSALAVYRPDEGVHLFRRFREAHADYPRFRDAMRTVPAAYLSTHALILAEFLGSYNDEDAAWDAGPQFSHDATEFVMYADNQYMSRLLRDTVPGRRLVRNLPFLYLPPSCTDRIHSLAIQ